MRTDVAEPKVAGRLTGFVRDVVAEMKKVTWPDRNQVRQLSILVVVFALLVGAIIAIMDLVLQGVLVQLAGSLRGR